MITTEDHLAIRLKMMDRFKTSFPWLGNQVKNLRVKKFSKSQTAELGETEDEPLKDEPLKTDNQPPGEYQSTAESSYIQVDPYDNQPPHTILIGICDDDIPLTLSLDNPAPGALLLIGDTGAGKTRLARSILTSAMQMNTPEQVVYSILASDIHEYTDLAEYDNCRSLFALRDPALLDLIDQLYEEGEKRRSQPDKQAVLLVIDDLSKFVQRLNIDRLTKLVHLIKHGPRLRIWIAAALSARDVDSTDPSLLDAFRTHLLGSLADPVLATYLGGDASCPVGQLDKGNQFCASVGGEWLKFWIYEPQGGVE
jgi:hypothetical protein